MNVEMLEGKSHLSTGTNTNMQWKISRVRLINIARGRKIEINTRAVAAAASATQQQHEKIFIPQT